MAYSKKKLTTLAINAIREFMLVFQEDIFAYVPYDRATYFARELHKSDTIKKELYTNRVNMKNGLRAKWYKSNNSSVQIALYKLIADEDELKRLTNINIQGELKDGVGMTPKDIEDISKTNDEVYLMSNGNG